MVRATVRRERPLAVSVLVIMLDIGAGALLIASTVGIMVITPTPPEMPPGIHRRMVGLCLRGGAVGLGVLVVGHFLWRGAEWARIALMVILLYNLVLRVIEMLFSGVDAVTAVSIVAVLIFVWMLNGGSAKEYCANEPLRQRCYALTQQGVSAADIAKTLGRSVRLVRKWRARAKQKRK